MVLEIFRLCLAVTRKMGVNKLTWLLSLGSGGGGGEGAVCDVSTSGAAILDVIHLNAVDIHHVED